MPLALDRASLDIQEPDDFIWSKATCRPRSSRRMRRAYDVTLVGDILRSRPDIPPGRVIPSPRTKRVIVTSSHQVKSLDVFLADYEDAQIATVVEPVELDLLQGFASLEDAAVWFDLPLDVESLEDLPPRQLAPAPDDDDWGNLS